MDDDEQFLLGSSSRCNMHLLDHQGFLLVAPDESLPWIHIMQEMCSLS
jgi:hypothetical protein